jgi:hypothetical protein
MREIDVVMTIKNLNLDTQEENKRTLGVKIVLLTVLLGLALSCGGGSGSIQPPPKGTASYYVDCSAATNGDGTQASPWNSLSGANATAFGPGDQLLFKGGTICLGALSPAGSGSTDAPIVIDAYGTGAQPIIDGGTSNAVISLTDQQYWEIRNLEIVGGNKFGVFISGNTANSSLNHFHLINLNVHGAHYTSTNTGDSGEVFISPAGVHQILNDVLLDGVSAHDTLVSEGIIVDAGGDFNTQQAACQKTPTPANALGNSITIQNSTVHDVYGDGVLVLAVSNGLMQNNVVYHSGLCPNCGRTTSGLWQWCCHSCTIQGNESYANKTGGGAYDGGDFDIDLYNNDNIVQYNYGHDSDGYCVLFVGDSQAPSSNNIFRYNICANNGQNGAIAPQGEAYVTGWVSDVQIYNNTFYSNPAISSAAFLANANPGSDSRLFENNIIYSAVPQMIQTPSGYTLDNNIYWTTSTSSPTWQWNGVTYTDFSAYQSASGQDAFSYNADPMLNDPTYHSAGRPSSAFTLQTGSPARSAGTNVCLGINGCSMGTQDFFGNPLPNGSGYDIGANQAP